MKPDLDLYKKMLEKKDFTPVEISLSEFLLDPKVELDKMNLQQVADAAFVSKPSIIRLFQKVDKPNFKQFSLELELEKKLWQEYPMIENYDSFTDAETFKKYAELMGGLSKKIIDNCIDAIEEETLDKITKGIYRAERVFIQANQVSKDEIASVVNRMKLMGIDCELLNKDNVEKIIPSLTKDDAIILVTMGELAKNADKQTIEELMESPAFKVLVTTSNDPDKNYDVDYSLYKYPEGEDYIRNNEFVSQMTLLLGTNVIVGCLNKLQKNKKQRKRK